MTSIHVVESEEYQQMKVPAYIEKLHLGVAWRTSEINLDMDAVVMTFNKRGAHLETIEGLGNTKSQEGAIEHYGDSVTGGESGDAETISVSLNLLDPRTAAVVLIVQLPRGTFRSAKVSSVRSRAIIREVTGDDDGDGLDDDTQRARELHEGDELIVFKRCLSAPTAEFIEEKQAEWSRERAADIADGIEVDEFDTGPIIEDSRENNIIVLNRLYRSQDDKHRWILDTSGNVSLSQGSRHAVSLSQYSLIDIFPKIKIPGRDTGINTVKDLMNRIDVRVINKLEREFRARPDRGLSVHEFIECMMKHAGVYQSRHPSKEEELRVVALIRELFSLIDVDGDGTMDWEELTAYVVQAGLMATAENTTGDDGIDPEALEMVFKRDRYIDTSVHGKGISFLQWYGGSLNRVAVCDEFASCLKLYDKDNCKFSSQLDLPKPVGKDKPSKITILCSVHISEEQLIVLSASDFVLYVWDMNKGILGRRKPKIIKTLTAPTSQIALAWDNHSKTLFSASVNQEILAWDIQKRKIKGKLKGHRDMIVHLVVIPELDILASASLDDTVNLYGMSELRLWGSCLGHKKGVRRLAWGHGLLYSCGFEFVVRCWLIDVDETGKRSAKGETIIILDGAHEVMLLDVAVVPAAGARILSCDVSGKFVVWDVGSNARFSGEGMVLQEFTAGGDCKSGPPLDIDGMEQGNTEVDEPATDGGEKSKNNVVCTLVAGCSKIIRFSLVHTHTKKVDVPSQVLFNPNTLQFFTLAGNDIHIWDASLGTHVHSFWNIFEASGRAENIECMCFDTRRRKIIAGSEGGQVYVFNSVSGAPMKGIKAHHSAVVSVHYADRCRCIISAGTDRRVLVHDESGENLMLLRAVSSLHPRSIDCCAFSEEFSQIATGSSDGLLRLVDFEKLVLRSDFVMPETHSSNPSKENGIYDSTKSNFGNKRTGNVTAVAFAPKHRPLLISCMSDGVVAIWRLQLSMRAPGENGVIGPLMIFNLAKKCLVQTLVNLSESTDEPNEFRNMPIQCSFTAMAVQDLGIPQSMREDTLSEGLNTVDTGTTYHDEKQCCLESSCEMLILADEDGFLNEIDLKTIFECGDLATSEIVRPLSEDKLPYNAKDYNSNLRYEEYKYYDARDIDSSGDYETDSDSDSNVENGNNSSSRMDNCEGTFITATSGSNTEGLAYPISTQKQEETPKALFRVGIVPIRRWSAHHQSIVTVAPTSTPPLILTGSEDECVHVYSLCPPGLDSHGNKINFEKKSILVESNSNQKASDLLPKGPQQNISAEAAAKAFGDPTREEFYGALSHHKTRDDDPFDEWHLPLDGLDLTSRHNKEAEKLLAEAERERREQLVNEQEALERSLQLNSLREDFQSKGLLKPRQKSKEVLVAQTHSQQRTADQKAALRHAMTQVKDEDTPVIPTWGDFFQGITEDKKEKAFSEASLIRGGLAGFFGGEELERLRMIRAHGMHHIYSFFPPAINGGDDPMPLEPQTNGAAGSSDGNNMQKSSPAVYLNFRAERNKVANSGNNASKKQRELDKALAHARPSKFLLQQLGPKKKRKKLPPVKPSHETSDKSTKSHFFLTPIPSMISSTSNSSSFAHNEESSFLITGGFSQTIIGSHDNKSYPNPTGSASAPNLELVTKSKTKQLPKLSKNLHSAQKLGTNSTDLLTLKRPRRRSSAYGSTLEELQFKVDSIMKESDEIEERAEIEAAAKAARLKSKAARKAKIGRRSSLVSSKHKENLMKRKEKSKLNKQAERDKQKKLEARNRAWSKAGVSKREVLEIIHSFNSLDEDLTGEIDPREFFALPAFADFANSSAMDTLFRAIDQDGSGTVTQEELLAVMFPLATKTDVKEMVKMARESRFGKGQKKKKISRLTEKQRADIETIFKLYDTDGSNTVDLTELIAALGDSLRNIMTSAEIASIFAQFDTDDNADLELEEFIKLYEDYFLDSVNAAEGPPGY